MSDETVDMLTDLIDRLEMAEATLLDFAEGYGPLSHERIRAEGKANGLRLAISYAQEELRNAKGN